MHNQDLDACVRKIFPAIENSLIVEVLTQLNCFRMLVVNNTPTYAGQKLRNVAVKLLLDCFLYVLSEH